MYTLLIIYSISCIALLVLNRLKKPERTLEDDAVGSRDYGSTVVAITILATILGPADALGLGASGYQYGFVWVVFPLAGALAQAIFGKFFAARIRACTPNPLTIGDIAEAKFGRAARFFFGVVVFSQSIAFSAIMLLAGGKILEFFTGASPLYGMIFTALLVGIYTAFGGLQTVLSTEKLQIWLIGGLFFGYVFFGIWAMSEFRANLPADMLIRDQFWDDHGWTVFLGILATYFLGELLLPIYSQRAMIAKSDMAAQRGFYIAAVVVAIWYIFVVGLGALTGSLADQSQAQKEFVLVNMAYILIKDETVSLIISAFLMIGYVALVHSSLDTILNIGGVSFGKDILGSLFRSDESLVRWSAQQSMLAISMFSLIIAISYQEIIPIVILGYSIWIPSLLFPFGFAILTSRDTLPSSALAVSVFFGVLTWYAFENFTALSNFPIPSIMAGLLVNALSFILVDLFARRYAGP